MADTKAPKPADWQTSLAVWLAFSVFVGQAIMSRGDAWIRLTSFGTQLSVILAGGIIAACHLVWLYGIGLNAGEDEPLLNLSHGPQAMVTLVLLAASIAATRAGWVLVLFMPLLTGLSAWLIALRFDPDDTIEPSSAAHDSVTQDAVSASDN